MGSSHKDQQYIDKWLNKYRQPFGTDQVNNLGCCLQLKWSYSSSSSRVSYLRHGEGGQRRW